MKKIDETKTQYDSVMEFAVLGEDDEEINLNTLIATKIDKTRGEE